jgi:hypothetical protein
LVIALGVNNLIIVDKDDALPIGAARALTK